MELEKNCSACNKELDFTKDQIKYIYFDGKILLNFFIIMVVKKNV
jgi:hypothetical protein